MPGGIFGNIFDFNGDGQIDAMERGAELAFLQMIMEDEEAQTGEDESNTDSKE